MIKRNNASNKQLMTYKFMHQPRFMTGAGPDQHWLQVAVVSVDMAWIWHGVAWAAWVGRHVTLGMVNLTDIGWNQTTIIKIHWK